MKREKLMTISPSSKTEKSGIKEIIRMKINY